MAEAQAASAAQRVGPAQGAETVEKSNGKVAPKTRVQRQKSELDLLSEISSKLDRLVAVLATQGKDRDTQVAILASAGCDSAFVGTVVGMSAGAVRKLPAWRRAQGEPIDAARSES